MPKNIPIDRADIDFMEQLLIENFMIKKTYAKRLSKQMATIFKNGHYEELFQILKYEIYTHHSKTFSNQVLSTIFNLNYYLQTKYTEHAKAINSLVYELINTIYNQSIYELEKLEKSSKRTQNTLLNMTKTLNNTLRTQQLMLANISHEMRTSLNAVLGYSTYIIENQVSKHDQEAYLTKIHKASLSLKTLVSDILDVSKINSDQMEIKNSPFWLDETIMNSIDNISLMAENKNINLTTHVDCFIVQLFGDSQRIMQILTNLLSNAIKFTPSKGNVDLSAKIASHTDTTTSILISVKDDGIGMESEALENILQPYVRFETKTQGLGLGLHITHKLIQKMGGKLSIESAKGKGSTFSVHLTLNHMKSNKISLKNRCFYFFNDTKDKERETILIHKIELLESIGARVQLFTDKDTFIKILLDIKEDIPDLISITSCDGSYAEFDALVYFLKAKPHFNKTYFVAEQIRKKENLIAFNQAFIRFANISTYLNSIKVLDKKPTTTTTTTTTTLSILAIDDIETNLEILKLLIEKRFPNAHIDFALGGYEAVGMYRNKTYDLIFLDIKMPGMDGFTTLKKLMEVRIPPPTYALTADVYKDTYQKVKSVGFTGLHEKPLKPKLIFETIEGVIDAKYIKKNAESSP